MIKLFTILAAAAAFLMPQLADAQAFLPGKSVADTNPQPVKPTCWNGSAFVQCSNPVSAPTTITAMTGATSAGTQSPSAGIYNLELPATFNGATITLTATSANGKVSTFTYTSAVAAKTCFRFSSGTTVAITASGGTPTGSTILAGAVQCAPPAVENYAQLALTANVAAQIAVPMTGMINGLVCTAPSTNTTDVLVGQSGVTTGETGTGTGYPIIPGGSWAAGINTTANTWFISSASAVIFCHGN